MNLSRSLAHKHQEDEHLPLEFHHFPQFPQPWKIKEHPLIYYDDIKPVLMSARLETFSWKMTVKLYSQNYFCLDTTHFWPDKYPLSHNSQHIIQSIHPRYKQCILYLCEDLTLPVNSRKLNLYTTFYLCYGELCSFSHRCIEISCSFSDDNQKNYSNEILSELL